MKFPSVYWPRPLRESEGDPLPEEMEQEEISKNFRGLRASFVTLAVWVFLSFAAARAEALSGPLLRFEVDPQRSLVRVGAKILFFSLWARAGKLRGDIYASSQILHPRAGGTLEIEAGSVDTGYGWGNRILWEEMLEVNRYPVIRVSAREVAPMGGDKEGDEFLLRASLTLHGVSRDVAFPVIARLEDEGIIVQGATAIRMSDFGIRLPRILLFFRVRDEVDVELKLAGRRVEPGASFEEARP